MFDTLFVIAFTKTGVGSLGRARSVGRSLRGSHVSWPETAAAEDDAIERNSAASWVTSLAIVKEKRCLATHSSSSRARGSTAGGPVAASRQN